MKNELAELLGAFIGWLCSVAVFWGATIGFIKLITICLSLDFSMLRATGIWLILCLLRFMFRPNISNKG